MLIKSKYLIFLPTLVLGTLLTLSSSSWISAWMGLEINLMSIAPILINKMTLQSAEASIKYFIAQAIASILLIFFVLLPSKTAVFTLNQNNEIIVTGTLLLKAGAAPLHFWFPQVMTCASWPQCLILLTWQKIAPLALLSFISNLTLTLAVILSALIGGLGGLNQTNLKLLLTYSSIAHSAWMLSIINMDESSWWVYFSSYAFITLATIYLFYKLNISDVATLQLLKIPTSLKAIFLLNFMSLAGLPPLLGFLIKVVAINSLLINSFGLLLIASLILASFISFYYYLRLTYATLFMAPGNHSMAQLIPLPASVYSMYLLMSLTGNLLFPWLIVLT